MMRTFITFLILLLMVKDAYGQISTGLCNGEDVIFLLDSSSSIWRPDFMTQLVFFKNVTKNYAIGPGEDQTRVGAVTFSDNVHLRFHLKDNMDKASLVKAIDQIRPRRGNTNTADAIDYANDVMFTEENGSRTSNKISHVIVIITDGQSNDKPKTIEAASRAKARGIKIFAVGVGDKADFGELRQISSQPHEDYVFHAAKYESLSELQETLAARTCGALTTPATIPTTTTLRTTTTTKPSTTTTVPSTTTTVPSTTTTVPSTTTTIPSTTTTPSTTTWRMINIQTDKPENVCKSKPFDVYFVLDASNSIWINDYNKQLQFVADVVRKFDIGPTKTRVGVVVFSDKYVIHIKLSVHDEKAPLIEDILKTPYLTGITNTADAIRYLHEIGFSDAEARSGVGETAVIITDGVSRDPEDTAKQAKLAKDAGIYMFAIGVGSRVDKKELEAIASYPPEKYMFQVANYSALRSIESALTTETCEIVSTGSPTGAPKPTTPGNVIQDSACPGSGMMDVMFVLDARKTPVMHATRVVQQIILVIEKLNMKSSRIKAGLLSNNCDRALTSDLVFLVDFASQLQRFMADELLSFDFLLRKLAREVYTEENGSRSKAQRKAILYVDDTTLITDDTLRLVDSIKLSGVDVYVVAVGDDVNYRVINQMASTPADTYVIQVGNYAELRNLYHKILNILCPSTAPKTTEPTRGTLIPQ